MYDFAIIGSGVSGGRIAYEMTAGGAKCVLVEAGRRFDRHSYPPGEMGYSTQLFWGGGVEISRDGRLGFLRARCLGGTSVVNQADLDRFDDLAWDDWRARSGVDFFTAEAIEPYYARVLGGVAAGQIPPEHHNRNAEIFKQAFARRDWHWQPITRAQSDCALEHGSDCIVCLGGCPRDAKQSTLVTVIPRAVEQGLAVETEFEVQEIVSRADSVALRGRQRGSERELIAARAVLAGGAFGNVALLGRSPEMARRLPKLGHGFACHPQFMTYGLFDEPVNAHKGALQSVQAHDERLRRAGLKLENVYAPPIATAMLIPGLGTAHHAAMKNYRYYASIEVAIRDEAVGRLVPKRSGKLVVDKGLTAEDWAKIRQGQEEVLRLFAAVGAKRTIECHQAFGLHLMGGCAIGAREGDSVVNPNFEVHGFPRISVADSSIFPAAPGINPSFTIMALSALAAERLLAR